VRKLELQAQKSSAGIYTTQYNAINHAAKTMLNMLTLYATRPGNEVHGLLLA